MHLLYYVLYLTQYLNHPANIYLFKVIKRNLRKSWKLFSKIAIKRPERRYGFFVNFEYIHTFFLCFFWWNTFGEASTVESGMKLLSSWIWHKCRHFPLVLRCRFHLHAQELEEWKIIALHYTKAMFLNIRST